MPTAGNPSCCHQPTETIVIGPDGPGVERRGQGASQLLEAQLTLQSPGPGELLPHQKTGGCLAGLIAVASSGLDNTVGKGIGSSLQHRQEGSIGTSSLLSCLGGTRSLLAWHSWEGSLRS